MAVKKSSKPAEIKTNNKLMKTTKDLRSNNLQELTDQLLAVRNNLSDARRSLVAGELVNPRVINSYKKEIARLKTIMVEKAREATGKEDA
ncbi:50S ribosomal protein L29 [Candidatus Saccharibacteria bacterium]|nr:50S ribosomal protein L29 [Candidatus Saccharibacteria bacterium]NCU40969.1 50S ribosomal protein L29 [Candidatus Saccharibacteria bacterium]